MLITVPAAIALGICAVPLVTAFFRGGHFSLADATITGRVLACLVAGLPAYVLVKVLTPGFYARKDTKTPVKTARSEEHTSELQSLMRISYAVFCLKKKINNEN